MTYKEILEKLKNSGLSVEDFAYGEFGNSLNEEEKAQNEKKDKFWRDNLAGMPPGDDYQKLRKECDDIPSGYELSKQRFLKELGIGEIEEVDQYGGEGQGDTWYSVKYFKDHDVYIRVDGWYTSYDGTDFNGWDDSCSEVRPKQKTITVYETL